MNFFNKHKKTIYISLFAALYGIVAFSSLWHAISFFGLANNVWMAIILATAFEIGQAATLFALLTSSKDRSKVMPWVLMTMFTLVQVLGNVYSSYKHIITNSVENLRFFKEPVFIWTNLPDDQATVIITYLVGGVLPITALLLTSMVTNYLEDTDVHNNVHTDAPNNLTITNDIITNEQVNKDNVDDNKEPQSKENLKNENPNITKDNNLNKDEKEQGRRTEEGDDVQDVQINKEEPEEDIINPKKSHLIS